MMLLFPMISAVLMVLSEIKRDPADFYAPMPGMLPHKHP